MFRVLLAFRAYKALKESPDRQERPVAKVSLDCKALQALRVLLDLRELPGLLELPGVRESLEVRGLLGPQEAARR